MVHNIIKFKGIKFYNTDFNEIFKKIKKGGYLVAPAASALCDIDKNRRYYQSLLDADVAILDSGFFCILLRIFKGKKVKKFSGYLFLKTLLNQKFANNIKFLNIDPNQEESKINHLYLKKKNLNNIKSYVAPKYLKSFHDKKLINIIEKFKPNYILINIGGGTQEILAQFIVKKLKFKTSIICTGAAIAFLTKKQAPINDMIDKFYLGWMLRIMYNPKKSFFRTIRSLLLVKFFLKM